MGTLARAAYMLIRQLGCPAEGPSLAAARRADPCDVASAVASNQPTASPHIGPALELLEGVYGRVDAPGFPRALPEHEAGSCANGDRRYLWTDAFAVLALVSIADALEGQTSGAPSEFGPPETYRRAADALIEAVHTGLGRPRSPSPADAMRPDSRSPTGFAGLRVGKPQSAPRTDAGMALDGQYWHYLDKWLLALVRADRADEAAAIGKVAFERFFDRGPTKDGRAGGIRWKLSVDASAPPDAQQTFPSDDTLVALIVFGLIEHHRSDRAPSLREEADRLRAALCGYEPDVTSDALGWGCQAIYDTYLEDHPWTKLLSLTAPVALDMRHLVELPFRLYGAILGARAAATCPGGQQIASAAAVESLLACALEHERRAAQAKPGVKRDAEHASLSRVMLASACVAAPGAFARRKGEPLVTLKL